MSHVHEGPLATYNSLTDPNLSGYFGNTRMRKHLRKSGLVNRTGSIVTENQYRLNMARKEHKKHVKDLLAQAIVHKTLDLERYRQVEIKKKLEEIAKIEMVRRVRTDERKGDGELLPLLSPKPRKKTRPVNRRVVPRKTSQILIDMERPEMKNNLKPAGITQNSATRGRKGDEEVLPYLTPRSQSRPQSDRASEASSHKRPKSAPAPPRGHKSGYTDPYDDVIYVDDDGRPVSPPPPSDRQSYRGSMKDVRPDNIDTRHLYALNSESLQQYAQKLSRSDRGRDGAASPYIISQMPVPPKQERVRSTRSSPRRSARMSARPEVPSGKHHSGVKGTLMLHRQEPAMLHQGEVQTLCEITMKYHGPNLTLPRDQHDPTQEVCIEQQHCGGNTLPVFKERLQAGSTFTFISRRHRGYPFSLTMYIDGRVDCRVSTCCEYKHAVGVKLGGKMGHFSLTGITGATPCYKCKLSCQAPPRSLKMKKGKKKQQKKVQGDEEVTVEGTPRTPITPKQEPEVSGKSDTDNYDDDFEEEDSKDNKYEDDFEPEEVEESKDRRQIIGLHADEARVNGKTVTVDVAEKDKEQEKEGTLPAHRRIEGYSSEDEDMEGHGVTTPTKKSKGERRRSRSSSSSSSSSRSSSSEREVTPRREPEKIIVARAETPEQKTVAAVASSPAKTTQQVVEVNTARSDNSTTSGDLTTETESNMEHTPKPPETGAPTRTRRPGSRGSTSSSSTLTSDSEDEKYQRKKREEKMRLENEQRRKDEEEERRREQERREVERQEKLAEEERKRQGEESERKQRFELQRQESQLRLQKMEEERKTKLAEENRRVEALNEQREEARKQRLAEEGRMQRDYERQLSLIQSQRDSDMSTSASDDVVRPREQVVKDKAPESVGRSIVEESTYLTERKEERKASSSSSSSDSSSDSESENEEERKKKVQPVVTGAAVAVAVEEKAPSPVKAVPPPATKSSSSSSSSGSSTSGSDSERDRVKAPVTPMKPITETVPAVEQNKTHQRKSSTSSTGSSGSSSSSSSDGEYTVTKQAGQKAPEPVIVKPQSPPLPVLAENRSITPAVASTPAKKVKSSSSSSSGSSTSGSSSESDDDNKRVMAQKTETTVQPSIQPSVIQQDVAKTPPTQQKPPTSSSSSSSGTSSSSESDSDRRPKPVGATPSIPPVKEVPSPVHVQKQAPPQKPTETEDSSSDSSSGSSSDSSDSEDESRRRGTPSGGKTVNSESEPDTTHGGNDPDRVGKDGGKSRSALVNAPVPTPKVHYGSIMPFVEGNSVEFSGIKLDEGQMTELGNHIAQSDRIKSVTVRNAALDDSLFSTFVLSLQMTQSNPTLLNFSLNQLGPHSITPLAAVIKNKPGIEIIILHGNPLGNVGCKMLVNALSKAKDPFPFLRRSSGYLTPSEARAQKDEGKEVNYDTPEVAEGSSIKELDLADTKISDFGVAEISKLLEANKTLVTLNLSGNPGITALGWERLGQGLKKNTTLKTLSLDHTNIGDNGIENLARSLKENTCLQELELENSGLTEKGGKILLNLLKSSASIKEVTVTAGNSISDETLREIRKCLQQNREQVVAGTGYFPY